GRPPPRGPIRSPSSGPSHSALPAVVFGSTGKPGSASPRTLTCDSSSSSRRTAIAAHSFPVVEDRVDHLRGDAVRMHRLADPLAPAGEQRQRERPPERRAHVARGDVARAGRELGALVEALLGQETDELLAVA